MIKSLNTKFYSELVNPTTKVGEPTFIFTTSKTLPSSSSRFLLPGEHSEVRHGWFHLGVESK